MADIQQEMIDELSARNARLMETLTEARRMLLQLKAEFEQVEIHSYLLAKQRQRRWRNQSLRAGERGAR